MSVLNPQTFAVGRLANNDGLSDAWKMLESCLAGPDTYLDLIVQDLCSVPNLFEFVISVWPRAAGLVVRIMDAYPFEPALIQSSLASALLRQLSSVLFALPPDLFSTDTLRDIGRLKVYVEDALPVLSCLCSSDFINYVTAVPDPRAAVIEEPDCDDDELSGFFVCGKKQKKQRRKNIGCRPTIDLTPFHKFGATVPSSAESAVQMAREITEKLKKALQFYLDLLLEPILAQPLKDAYLPAVDNDAVRATQPENLKATTETIGTKPSAYPMVQPMKAALYFDNADGFGEWRILVSTEATKRLREFTKNDRKKCGIVVKKIKQLSNGHFSEDNQKRLNESSGVPIFEAKMQRDLRLVYQVDVISDNDSEVERQVIKIYGIYTHTQLNRIWDAIGQHLAGKGKEYRRRCIYRNRPARSGDDVYLPACFPPEVTQISSKPTPFILSDEDKDELHSLLVLEKYVTFSQAFLHSLIANQDVQHVFELSSPERKIVECSTSCYVLGRSGTGKTTTMLFKMLGIQRAWELQTSGMPKPRQIFVTKSRVLVTKVEEYFTKLLESLALAGCSLEELKRLKARNTEVGLVDLDDLPEDQSGIPRKYTALEQKHFPLFVTFDKLAKMIAADVLGGDNHEARSAAKLFINTDDVEAQDSFVTYEVFAHRYWPHFPQPLTKGLEPWLVFSEFMGIIKGSEMSLSCPDGFLDEKTYCSLPPRSNPTFATQRQTIYTIFEAYCKLKRDFRHHDVADRTHAILKMLLGGTPFKGQKVDYLYVDEAQDNLLIDALLLRLICRNPEGLFWAGDTAQTISAGSSFRFNDLKAFLYRIEQDQGTQLIQERSITDPTVFQLAVNYRSHGGIVNCAHTVIERITRFWPDAIDGLQPEHGIVDGLKPVFFHGWDKDTVRYEQFLFGACGSHIDFGAQQCILVRDDEARDKLREQVGDIGLIMTLYESKGLEFNDVLLYNFFEDSAVDLSRWRVLLNYTEGEVGDQDLSKVHVPSFERDEGRFAGVCSELKLLYVGITRARKNMWIVDKSVKSEPMRMVWTSRDQVQNCTPGTDVPHLAVSSTPAEWESFGRNLFKHKRYPQAMHCFARASLPRMVAICQAFHLREAAHAQIGTAPRKNQQQAFLVAADAFMDSGNDAPESKDKLQYHRNAAKCYEQAGDDRKAAIAYLAAQEYDLAARRYRKAGLFDETLEILEKHSQRIPSESTKELYTVCRLFYYSKGNKPPIALFSSVEDELEFLEDYDLDFARASLFESRGRYLEAAELHLAENRPLDAIRDFLKETGSRDATKRATDILLEGLWRRCSFGIPSKAIAGDRNVIELLALAHELPVELLHPFARDEICMFQAISQGDLASLDKLAATFLAEEQNASALLALDHICGRRLLVLKSANLPETSVFLTKFLQYTRLLYQIISHPNPISSHSIKRLFCISEVSGTEYGMELGSFLHSYATSDRDDPKYPRPSKFTLSRRDTVFILRQSLAKHLREQVTAENELCHDAVVFSQCLAFIINGYCNRSGCPQDHIGLSALDATQYNARIYIHLQQIRILQTMYSANPQLLRRDCVLDWLSHLYEAFNPQFHVQGSTADLDLSMIPGGHESIRVMNHWVRDALYGLDPNYDRPGFLTAVLKLTSLIFAFDRSDALKCINQAPFNTRHMKPHHFLYLDGRYLVEDIVNLFDGVAQTSISSGILFLRHILKNSLFVNISVFCDCLEEVVGKIAVSWRLSYVPPLNALVLPRGWLSSNKDFSHRKDVKIVLVLDLLDCVRDLLIRLQSSSASDTFKLSHAKLTPMLCNVFISRICRILCLLAYNISNFSVKSRVESILTGLRTVGVAQIYKKYAYARRNEYLKVMATYDENVVIEDLVHLVHKRWDPRPPQISSRIKQILYENPEDIPNLLASQLVAAHSDLRVDTQAFVHQPVYISQTEVIEDLREDPIQSQEPDLFLDQADETHEEPQELPPVTDEPALICGHDPTEEEICAAQKIQAIYRKYRRRRDILAHAVGSGTKAERNMVFIACLNNVYASSWQRSYYRSRYLWALPHLVVCLDKAIAIAYEFKGRTKSLLSKERHERLEELGQQRSEITALIKHGHNLRKEIEPNAAMHQKQKRVVKALEKAVLNVKDFLHRLPTAPGSELQDELQTAYQIIMVEKQDTKPEKPTLNMEDLDIY